MMRLCCLSLSYARQFNARNMDIFKFLDTCRALDLDGVSVHIRNLNGTDKAHLKEVRRRCLDLGLTMACFCVSTRFGGPEDTHPAEIAKAREAMDVGMFLGAPLLRVFVGRIDLDGDGREKWIDYDKVFNILRGVHFNGFISLAYEGKEDQSTAIPRGNQFLRSFLTA